MVTNNPVIKNSENNSNRVNSAQQNFNNFSNAFAKQKLRILTDEEK